MLKNLFKTILVLSLIATLNSCADKDPVTGKKVLREPNLNKRLEKEEGFIFGKKQGGVALAGSNVMWKATLEVLDFIPIENASYTGGLISTSWYSGKSSKESIKFNIKFYSDEISPNSIKILNFKKICDQNNNCSIVKGSEKINQQLKNKILEKTREFKIAQGSKK